MSAIRGVLNPFLPSPILFPFRGRNRWGFRGRGRVPFDSDYSGEDDASFFFSGKLYLPDALELDIVEYC